MPRFTLVVGTLPWCFGALPWFVALYLGFWDVSVGTWACFFLLGKCIIGMPTRTGLFFFSFFFSVGNSIIGMPNLEVPRFTLVLGTLPWCFDALPWFLALYLGTWA